MGNKISIVFFLLAFVIFISVLLFKEGTLPVNKKSEQSVVFIIPKGSTLNQIINKLASENLIRNRFVFYLIIKQMGIERKIQAGDYRLSSAMSAYQLAKSLTKETLDEWITIIEGMRREEVAQRISQSIAISEIQFVQQTQEGYLFPDTYLVPKSATVEQLVAILTKTFQEKFTQDMKDSAKKRNLTPQQVVILASLVEREARTEEDKKQVANILLKRYESDWPLQIDATVQYLLGFQKKEKTWWKKNLTENDLQNPSPYNTYKNKGLPPGPICNPGLVSLQAVANADSSTPYWYYISDTTGKMHYSKTLEEHDANVQEYLR